MHSLNVHKRPSNTWILVWASKWKYYVELLSLIKNYLCCPLTSLSKIIKEAMKFTNFSLRGSSSVSKISQIILQLFLYDDISLEKQFIILTLVICTLFFQAIYFLKFCPIFSALLVISVKVHIFWEGHTILQNLHQLFDWHYIGQIIGGDFAKF